MNKNVILFCSIALFSLLYSCDIRKQDKKMTTQKDSSGQQANADFPATTIQLIDTVHHFGTIKEGEIAEYNFRFKNTGKNALHITDALASCGCTKPEVPEHDVLPGETGFIKVKFNSAGKPGEIEKTITVTSNADPEFPQMIIKGTVIGEEE